MNAGVEQDFTSSMDNFSGTINTLGSFSYQAPTMTNTRGFATLGLDLAVAKNQRVSLYAVASQQPFASSMGHGAGVNYTIGF